MERWRRVLRRQLGVEESGLMWALEVGVAPGSANIVRSNKGDGGSCCAWGQRWGPGVWERWGRS